MRITITIEDATPELLEALGQYTGEEESGFTIPPSDRPADHTPAVTPADHTPHHTPSAGDFDTLAATVRARVGELVTEGASGKTAVRAALASQGVKKVTELPETIEAYTALLEALA